MVHTSFMNIQTAISALVALVHKSYQQCAIMTTECWRKKSFLDNHMRNNEAPPTRSRIHLRCCAVRQDQLVASLVTNNVAAIALHSLFSNTPDEFLAPGTEGRRREDERELKEKGRQRKRRKGKGKGRLGKEIKLVTTLYIPVIS